MSARSYRPSFFLPSLVLSALCLVPSTGFAAAAETTAAAVPGDQAPSVWRDGVWTTTGPIGAAPAGARTAAAATLRAAAAANATPGSDPLDLWPLVQPDGGAEIALFSADVDGDRCLWRTDGTAAGTFRLTPDGECVRLRPDSPFVGAANGVGYFVVTGPSDRYWRSDGTAAGTWPLTSAFDDGLWSRRFNFVAAPPLGLVLFAAGDGGEDVSLWASDGSPASATPLDVAGLDGVPFRFQVVGSEVFFFIWRNSFVFELWRTDGTPAGTVRVREVGSEDFYTGPRSAYATGNRLVFFLGGPASCMVELWVSDGTPAGTQPLRAFTGTSCPVSGLFQAVRVDGFPGSVFFAPDEGGGAELWRTDGSLAGTFALTDLAAKQPFPAHFPLLSRPVGIDGEIFFAADGGDGHGREPWKSDGTPDGALRFADICPGDCSSDPGPMGAVDGHLVFAARDPLAGREPWVSDGTAAGTARAADLCSGSCDSQIQREVVFGDSLLFLADDGGNGQDWWTVTPSTGTALRLTDLAPPQPFGPRFLVQPLGERTLFVADDGEHGLEPWVTDGTPAGTHLLADLQGVPTVVEAPAAPGALTARNLGGGRVLLSWEDRSTGEDSFFVEASRDDGPFGIETVVGPEQTAVELHLASGAWRFRVRAVDEGVFSPPSNEATAQIGFCMPEVGVLCLGEHRFRVQVSWRNQHALPGQPNTGAGGAVQAGTDSGYFWFFTPDNLELVVKVLDGTSVNGHFWVFWGALSDVEYTIAVEDTSTGEIRQYHNPPGQICGGSDTAAFPLPGGAGFARTAGAAATSPPAAGPFAVASGPATRFLAVDAPSRATAALHPPQPCVPDDETLCLLDGTLAVTVDWRDQHNGGSGVGHALPYTDLTGFFWFFHPENVELVVKALDGRTVNAKIWVFYGALSDVGYTIRVDNRADGHAVRTYDNPPGMICGRGDTAAF